MTQQFGVALGDCDRWRSRVPALATLPVSLSSAKHEATKVGRPRPMSRCAVVRIRHRLGRQKPLRPARTPGVSAVDSKAHINFSKYVFGQIDPRW